MEKGEGRKEGRDWRLLLKPIYFISISAVLTLLLFIGEKRQGQEELFPSVVGIMSHVAHVPCIYFWWGRRGGGRRRRMEEEEEDISLPLLPLPHLMLAGNMPALLLPVHLHSSITCHMASPLSHSPDPLTSPAPSHPIDFMKCQWRRKNGDR